MANLFFTGFENASSISQIPGVISNNEGQTSISSTTRFSSGKSLSLGTYAAGYVDITNADTLFVGAAYYFSQWNSNDYLIMFGDNSTTDYTRNHISLRVADRNGTNATLKVYGPTGTLLGTGTANRIQLNTWQFIEVKVKIDNSVGEVEVRVDGTTDIFLNNIDTRQDNYSFTAYCNRVFFKGEVSNTLVDDLYINNNSGSSPHNTFYGEIRVDAVLPASDSSVQFTPSTGGSNYAMVDDGASPDGDSTYNSSTTAGHKDLLGLSGYSTPSGGTILGVNVVVSARRADPGTRTLRSVVKSSTTEVTGTTNALTSGYTFKKDTIFTDPATSAAFANATAINNLKVGYEIVA